VNQYLNSIVRISLNGEKANFYGFAFYSPLSRLGFTDTTTTLIINIINSLSLMFQQQTFALYLQNCGLQISVQLQVS